MDAGKKIAAKEGTRALFGDAYSLSTLKRY